MSEQEDHSSTENPFDYDRVDTQVFKEAVERLMQRYLQGKADPSTVCQVLIGIGKIFAALMAPSMVRRYAFWVTLVCLTVALALGLGWLRWPNVTHPFLLLGLGLVLSGLAAHAVSIFLFHSSARRATATADFYGLMVDLIVTDHPDLRHILDDISEAGLPIRRVVRRFITHRPADAIPESVIQAMITKLREAESKTSHHV